MEYVTTKWRKVTIGIDLLIEKLDKKFVYMAMFITESETDYKVTIRALSFRDKNGKITNDGKWTIVNNEGFILHQMKYICKCPIQPALTESPQL